MNAAVKFLEIVPQEQHSLGFHMWCEEDRPPAQGLGNTGALVREIDEEKRRKGKVQENHTHKIKILKRD